MSLIPQCNTKNNKPKIPLRKPTGFLDQSKSNAKHNEEKIPIIPSRKPVIQEPTGLSKSNTLPWIKKSKPPLPPMKPPKKMEKRKEMPDVVINTIQDETTGFFDEYKSYNAAVPNSMLSSSSHSNLCYDSSPISPNPILHSRSTSFSYSHVRI